MKTQFLIHKAYIDNRYELNCSILPEVVVSDSEDECIEILKDKLADFLRSIGKEYVDKHKGCHLGDEKINCPQGFVLLPLDSWHCKHDKALCTLQASIDPNNEVNFLKNCRAANKQSIFNTIEQQRYKGFHHTPGRHLCPSCDVSLKMSQQNFKYHYPWELYPLWDIVNFEDQEIVKALIKSDISPSVAHSKVCASCFIKVARELVSDHSEIHNLFILELDFYPR